MSQVVVKKVSPYPISLKLEKGGAWIEAKIVKLTQMGFLAEMAPMLKVGDQYSLHFEIPVLQEQIQALGKVIKTYDSYRDEESIKAKLAKPQLKVVESPQAGGGAAQQADPLRRLVEIHFQNLSDKGKQSIQKFLVAIRQR